MIEGLEIKKDVDTINAMGKHPSNLDITLTITAWIKVFNWGQG